MNKRELINEIANRLGVEKKYALKVLDVTFESINEGLIKDNRVTIGKWGTFIISDEDKHEKGFKGIRSFSKKKRDENEEPYDGNSQDDAYSSYGGGRPTI